MKSSIGSCTGPRIAAFIVKCLLPSLAAVLPCHGQGIASPLLWKAVRGGETAYIFGSLHQGISLDEFPGEFVGYVDRSSNILFESSGNDPDDAAVIFSKGFIPEGGQPLDRSLSGESWGKLVAVFEGIFDEDVLKALKPWFVTLTMAEIAYLPFVAPFNPLEQALRQRADERGLSVGYLEDASTMMSPFISLMEQVLSAELLDSELRGYDDPMAAMREEARTLFACYRASDLRCLGDIDLIRGVQDDPRVEDFLLVRRNRDWIAPIEESLATGPSFVVVGVTHLIGGENLLELLEGRGFTIERIPFDGTDLRP